MVLRPAAAAMGAGDAPVEFTLHPPEAEGWHVDVHVSRDRKTATLRLEEDGCGDWFWQVLWCPGPQALPTVTARRFGAGEGYRVEEGGPPVLTAQRRFGEGGGTLYSLGVPIDELFPDPSRPPLRPVENPALRDVVPRPLDDPPARVHLPKDEPGHPKTTMSAAGDDDSVSSDGASAEDDDDDDVPPATGLNPDRRVAQQLIKAKSPDEAAQLLRSAGLEIETNPDRTYTATSVQKGSRLAGSAVDVLLTWAQDNRLPPITGNFERGSELSALYHAVTADPTGLSVLLAQKKDAQTTRSGKPFGVRLLFSGGEEIDVVERSVLLRNHEIGSKRRQQVSRGAALVVAVIEATKQQPEDLEATVRRGPDGAAHYEVNGFGKWTLRFSVHPFDHHSSQEAMVSGLEAIRQRGLRLFRGSAVVQHQWDAHQWDALPDGTLPQLNRSYPLWLDDQFIPALLDGSGNVTHVYEPELGAFVSVTAH